MKKEIIFFNRAYNDMDIQLSLMYEFSKDFDYSVRVIGIPSDGTLGAPEDHEAAAWVRGNTSIKIENLVESQYAPLWLRLLYKYETAIRHLRKKIGTNIPGWLSFFMKVLHIPALRLIRWTFSSPRSWIMKEAATWSPSIVMVDEVNNQPNRSQIVDEVIPYLSKKGVLIYTMLTGQHVYYDPFPSNGKKPVSQKATSCRIFVPSQLDAKIYRQQFAQENPEVMGNLRMGYPWISKLKNEILISPYYNINRDLNKLPKGKIKIAFMLSKLSYGVEVDNLKDTIRYFGHMQDVALAIKPHTRGMKFDFMDVHDAGNAIDASDIPSAILTEWADIILVTGSSVVFHGMAAEKQVGILKYCQKMDTIYDTGVCCHVFNSKEDLEQLVIAMCNGTGNLSVKRREEIRRWLVENVYAGKSDGDIARHYKERMVADLLEYAARKAV